MVILHKRVTILKKLISSFLVLTVMAFSVTPFITTAYASPKGTDYPYVFVAGFAGWGSYDKIDQTLPYWGRLNGNLMSYLNEQGFESYAASVDPWGSAWDRACELYAQLTGKVVDYGEVHSAAYGHERFGTDYSKSPLITGWGELNESGKMNKINLIAHSFGGATVRLFTEIMAHGDQTEVDGTTSSEVSDFFKGGKADWIYSVTTLAAPHNGTTLTLLSTPITLINSIESVESMGGLKPTNVIYNYVEGLSKLMSGIVVKDTALYDLTIDGAAELNERLSPIKNIYYFSVPTDATTDVFLSKKRIPNPKTADPVLWPTILFMGRSTYVTKGGITIDKNWFRNDGVVNTISTTAPKNEAQKAFDSQNITPGIWNIMDTFKGDHASIIGGLTYAVNINDFYTTQMKLINSL